MKNKRRPQYAVVVFWALLVLAMILVGVQIALVMPAGPDAKTLAKCLASKNVVLYTISGCGACLEQIRMFGEAAQYLNIINCDAIPSICSAENITAAPTWKTCDAILAVGVTDLESLAGAAGCR